MSASQQKGMFKSIFGVAKPAPRNNRYEVESKSVAMVEGPCSDETANMISHPTLESQLFEEYRIVMPMLVFTPIFFVLFYLPHPVFAILWLLSVITEE